MGTPTYCYRPQRSYGKVMFSQASVILFTGGGLFGRHPPDRYPPPRADGYCSGRYASYWNAFLFSKSFAENCMKMKEIGQGCLVPSWIRHWPWDDKFERYITYANPKIYKKDKYMYKNKFNENWYTSTNKVWHLKW